MIKIYFFAAKHKLEKFITQLKVKRRNLILDENITFKGIPYIQIHNDAEIHILKGSTINSKNEGYHLNMFGPCKLMADRPNAKIIIGSNSRIHGTCIHARERIVIGNNCLIAANCQIMDSNGHDLSFPLVENRLKTFGESKKVIIGDNVWLGTGVVVLPGVTIGHGSVISANSVVHKDIPPMVVAGGSPIRIIKHYN
tara:strand:- start:2709 stop:3299 length:591 start_codon:yes stop_codon:yes gene_type:complete